MELCRGRLPGGAVWEQPAADGRVRAGGGGLRAAAGGHHRGLGGQESPPQRYEGSSRGQGQPPPGSRFPPPPRGNHRGSKQDPVVSEHVCVANPPHALPQWPRPRWSSRTVASSCAGSSSWLFSTSNLSWWSSTMAGFW